MIIRAFLGGFIATSVLLAFLASEPNTHQRVKVHDSAASRPTELQPANKAASVIAQPDASTQALSACNKRLLASLDAFGLRFDHRSEQLKAESRQLVFAIIEISVDCPAAHLRIMAPPGSARTDALTERRSNALIAQFRRGGLNAQSGVNDATPEDAGDWHLKFFVP